MYAQVERARRAIRVFFLIRELSLTLNMERETQLPLTNPADCVQVDNILDLSKSYSILTHYSLQVRYPDTYEYLIYIIFLNS